MGDRFRSIYRELTPEEQERISELKDRAADLETEIEAMQTSREKSLALTRLEEAVFWAVKGLTAHVR